MAAKLDDFKIGRVAQVGSEAEELAGENPTEQATDADAGEIVARPPDTVRPGRVVAVVRMIESQIHEPRKGNQVAGGFNFRPDRPDQARVAAGHGC